MAKQTAVATLQIDNTQAGIIAAATMQMNSGEFEFVSGNYMKFEPGETYNLVCMGLIDAADYNDANKMVPESAVELVTGNGIECINQDVVMVSTAKKLKTAGKTFPCLLRVHNKGQRQNSKGKEYADLVIGYAPITEALLNALVK